MARALPLKSRLALIWQSFRALPLWVQIWVNILAAANTFAFFVMDTSVGFWAAMAWLAVMALNLPILWVQAGFSRLLSIPHFIWAPLVVWLTWRLWLDGIAGPGGFEYGYALTLIVINSVSLAFDALDTWRWIGGQRGVIGRS